MSKRGIWIGILIVAGLVLGPSAACALMIFLSPCDMDGYVVDAQVTADYRADLEAFERTHDLDLDRQSMPLACTGLNLTTSVAYRYPAHQSRIGVTYELLLMVTYHHRDRSLELRFGEKAPDTQTTLDFLQMLPDRLAEFEQDPRVVEFADVFKREGVYLVGTINGDFFWIEPDPSRSLRVGLTAWSGNVTYNYETRTVTHYDVPNAFAWTTFEEVSRAQIALADPDVTEALAGCSLARGHETYANTDVSFRTTPEAADVDLRVVCPDDSRRYLELRLLPNGEVELIGLK